MLGVVFPEMRITAGLSLTMKDSEAVQVKPKVAVMVYVPDGIRLRSSVVAPLDHKNE